MNHKCDKCDRPATNLSVEIVSGEKITKHLCDLHAAEEGITVKAVQHTPINQLLTNFVKLHSGEGGASAAASQVQCEECGLTWAEFREHSLLGCPQCYETFDRQLSPLLERAHEGGSHHIGKTPRRCGAGGDKRHAALMRMRKRLDDAVAAEDYELAARLRDDISEYESERS